MKIRFYNENSEKLLKKFSPKNLDILKKNHNYMKIFDSTFFLNKKLQLEFGIGVMNFTLVFYYDGKKTFFEQYCKEVITESFNYGDFSKMNKDSFFFSFNKIVKKGSFFVEIGELWTKDFYINSDYF
tara:strand:- start:28 stop:408 length:381 start_codon:yes stop_codon:yes gene_type:complete